MPTIAITRALSPLMRSAYREERTVTDRVVKLLVVAEVNSFLAGTAQVAKASRDARSEADQLTARLEAQKKAFQVVGTAMLAAGGVVAAGLILATKRAAEFDQAMSNVQAATHESAENMALLRDAALEAGADTVYSAKEAAGAIEELAKAGLSTKSIIDGGLTGALDLAAAGGLGVADAAGIASTTLQQFGLEGNKASHVADVLAAGAGKAMGDVSDLSMALSQSGTVAAQFGLSLEETTGSLAAFASKGLLGSDAGTSFRSMLLRLANPTGEAAKKMQELGIQAYDAQGSFVGMTGLAGQLEKGLGKLTQEQRNAALAIIFGQDAIRAANVLYTEGAAGIAKWTKEVDDAGYAGETAATRLDNLNGDLEKLSGAFDTALITMGGAGQGPLRAAVQGITELVDGFNGMPDGAQTAVYWVGAVGAAVTLAGGAAFLAIPKVVAFRAAVQDLSPAAQTAISRLGRFTAILGGVATGAALAAAGGDALIDWLRSVGPAAESVANKFATAATAVDLLAAAEGKFGGAGTKVATEQLRVLADALDGVKRSGQDGLIQATALSNITRLGEEFGKLASTDLPAAQKQFRMLAEGADLNASQQQALLDKMEPYKRALTEQATQSGKAASAQSLVRDAMGSSTSATKTASDAYLEQADAANGVRDALKQLYDQMNAGNSAQQTAIKANADFLQGLTEIATGADEQRKAFEDANGTLDGFALSLDEATAAGSANAAMLAGIAGDAQAAAAAQYEVDQSTMGAKDAADKYAATLADQRQRFVDSAVAAGYNADQVQALADKVFALPSSKELEILAKTAQAQSDIDQLIWENNGRRITLNVDTNVTTLTTPGGLTAYSRASGGILPGAPSRRDSLLLHAAPGEFIVNAMSTAHPANRAALEYMNSGGVIQGFANGGFVQSPVYAAPAPQVRFPSGYGSLSIEGASISGTLEIGGDGLARIVDGRISLYDREQKQAATRGYDGGF